MTASSKQPVFKHRELAAWTCRYGLRRGRFVLVDDSEAVGAWLEEHTHRDVFHSVALFGQRTLQSPCLAPLHAAVRAEDLYEARDSAVKVLHRLNDRLGILPHAVSILYDGAHTFDLLVEPTVFGIRDDEHIPELLTVWRCLAMRLKKEVTPNLDADTISIADLVRLPNTINVSTGIYAVALEAAELDLGLEFVTETARTAREDDDPMFIPEESPRAIGWLAEALSWLRAKQAG